MANLNKEDIKNVWQKFVTYTETAEQHEFPLLAALQFKLEPFYNDLLENWDDHHADIFVEKMNEIFGILGIDKN